MKDCLLQNIMKDLHRTGGDWSRKVTRRYQKRAIERI